MEGRQGYFFFIAVYKIRVFEHARKELAVEGVENQRS